MAVVDDTVKEQIEAAHAKWEADLRLFKGSLVVDQRLIQKTEVGSWALHDILEWNDAEHVRSQGLIGKSLVHQFMDIHVPKAVASSWRDVPGAIASLVQRIHLQEGSPKNPPRFLAIIDFNPPNSRDSLNIGEIVCCVANTFKNFGVEHCALLAHMAAYAKEDSDQDPLEDEILIMKRPKEGRVQLTAAGPHAPSAARDHRVQPSGRRLARRQPLVLPVT